MRSRLSKTTSDPPDLGTVLRPNQASSRAFEEEMLIPSRLAVAAIWFGAMPKYS